MKIKVGEKLPNSEIFYLDHNNDVQKVDILDLCKDNKIIILGMPYVLEQMNKKWWTQTKRIIFVSIYAVINTYLLCIMTVNYTKKSKVEVMRYLREQGDVKDVYILNTSKGSVGQNINLIPDFYFGRRLKQNKIESIQGLNNINSDSIERNAYDLKETNLKNEIFDIIFLDPPFKDKEINILIDQIKMLKIANINTLIIIHRNKKSVDNISKLLNILDEKNYGLSKILFSKLI